MPTEDDGMECRIIKDSEIEKWESYVENNQTIAWQSYQWSEVVAKHYSSEFFPIAAFDKDAIYGIMPIYKIKTLKGKTQLISVPYAVGGGVSADNIQAENALIDAAIDLYNKSGAYRIIFKQYKHKLSRQLHTDDNFYNRELDLTIGCDKIFSNLAPANRENIEKASRLNLKLNYPSDDLATFYKLLQVHHKENGVPCVSKQWIKDLVGFKMYKIALLYKNGIPTTGTLVKEHKLSISFPFTSLPDDSEQSNMLAYYLYWQLIKKHTEEGKAIFHSGRIPNSNETNCYRLGWGGQKFNYYYQYYPNTSNSSEYKERKGRKRQILSWAWKKLPLSVTGILGPKIVKYYP